MPDVLNDLLGIGEDELGILQMGLRAVIMYLAALAMVRWGEKRFMGKNTAFDLILGVILGSVVSRAINGNAGLVPTLCAGFVLVAMHWLFASIAFRFSRFGSLIKGHTRVLVKDGKVDWHQMRRSHMTEDDLLGALRSQGNVDGWENVREARMERSGDISVIPKKDEPKVLDARIENGTLSVRIQLS